jgi:NAD(P)-dependent dehydrogenase (short-subunit alcohol dehydrogenase family)
MTVVLITGALTGIGRATALAFAKEGDQIIVSVGTAMRAQIWSKSSARLAQRPNSSAPMFDMTRKCGA